MCNGTGSLRMRMNRRRNDDSFIYGNVNSFDYGIYLTGIDIGGAPERDVSFVSVAGRNGDVIVDNGRWNNVDIIYRCAIADDFGSNFDGFKNKMLLAEGYQRLEDSVYPDVFRMAVLKSPVSPETMRMNRTGEFSITFNCNPQRFLKNGEIPISIEKSTVIENRWFPSKPIITIYGAGSGALSVGGITVELKDISGDITLDCEDMDAYRMADGRLINCNSLIYAPEFPVLQPGENMISWSGGVDHVEIIPRWWTL